MDTMRALSEVAQGPLYWVQPKTFARTFDLRTPADEQVGALRFEAPLGTLATGSLAQGRWTFKRVGFLRPRVTVREAGQETNVALFEPRFWGDGTIRLQGGREYRLDAANFWRTLWQVQDRDGEPLLTIRQGSEGHRLSDLFKTQAVLEVSPRGQGLAEIGLLVLLSWYVIVLQQEDTTAAAATVAAAAAS